MKIEINNSQKTLKIDRQATRKLVDFLFSRAHSLKPSRLWTSLNLVLLDNEGIAPVNDACFGRSAPTDVISLKYTPIPPDCGHMGEIFVNVEMACRSPAIKNEWSSEKELALYIAHGCDHLMDEDDKTPQDRRKMRRRELKWVREASTRRLLKSLFY